MVKPLNELAPLVHECLPEARQLLAVLCKNQKDVLLIYDHFVEHSHLSNEEAVAAIPEIQLTTFKKRGKELFDYLRRLVALSAVTDPSANTTVEPIMLQLLEAKMCRYSAYESAEAVLRAGLEFERPIWVVEGCRSLMRLYGLIDFDRIKDFQVSHDLLLEHDEYLKLLRRAEYFKTTYAAMMKRRKGSRNEVISHLFNAKTELEPYIYNIPSFQFHILFHFLVFDYHYITGNLVGGIDLMKSGIEYLESRAYNVGYFRAYFHANIAYTQRVLHKYDEGEKEIETAISYSQPGAFNWFSCQLVKFYLFLHQGKFQDAADVLGLVTQHRKFKELGSEFREIWQITGAYLYISITLHDQPLPASIKPYKSGKFLNEISHYANDKNGLYAVALGAHLILVAMEGNIDKAFDRIDALEKYRERYLLNDATPRTATYFKILIGMARHAFDEKQYRHRMPEWMEELRSARRDDNQTYEWEVIPYETLIELLSERVCKTGWREA
jgi:hypothetical protein